jgi:hypothetical protein
MDDVELAVKAELDRQAQRLVPRADSWLAFQQRAGARTRRRHWAGPALAVGFVAVIAVVIGITVWPNRAADHRTGAAGTNVAACSTNVLGSKVLYHPGLGHGGTQLTLVRLADGNAAACLVYGQNNAMTELTTHPGILGANVVTFQAEAETAGGLPAGWTVVGAISADTSQLQAVGDGGSALTESLTHSLTSIAGYRVFAAQLPPDLDPTIAVRLQALASDGSVLDTIDAVEVTVPKS